jgi:hypothetical protein
MYETEVKKLYRAYNKHTRSYTKFFPTLAEAAAFVVAQPKRHRLQGRYTDTLKRESDGKNEIHHGPWYSDYKQRNEYPKRWTEIEKYPAPDWVIVDDLGNLAPSSVISEALPRRWKYRDWAARDAERDLMEERRLKFRGDGLKIKLVYAVGHKVYTYRWGGSGYRENIRGYHRYIHTFRDHRVNCGHIEEYGEELVRGRRRCLPTTYDDRPNGSYKVELSWKHHSKRRKQWKPKG